MCERALKDRVAELEFENHADPVARKTEVVDRTEDECDVTY